MMKLYPLVLLLLISAFAGAQAPETPAEYMQFFNSREIELSKKYLSYMSEVAHGNRARKMEKRRVELLAEIKQNLVDASRLKPFKGDASLRDAYKAYWDLLYKIFNEDYHKIVDMEAIAEQSYDNMEAYLLAQEKAEEILQQAQASLGPVYNGFAANNNVRIIDEGDSKLEKKLRRVGRTNSYYHTVFLIFFKSSKQEVYLLDAYNRKDLSALEQNRATLAKFADEGLQKLDTLKPFDNDQSLITACRKVLQFHKTEAENYIPALSDQVMKMNDFEKIKKKFDAKPQNKRTQADIDEYNKGVNDYNASVNSGNKALQTCNEQRTKVNNDWDTAVKRFMGSNIPR